METPKGEDDNNNRAVAKEKLKTAIGEDKFDKIAAMIEENLAAESNKAAEEEKDDQKVGGISISMLIWLSYRTTGETCNFAYHIISYHCQCR